MTFNKGIRAALFGAALTAAWATSAIAGDDERIGQEVGSCAQQMDCPQVQPDQPQPGVTGGSGEAGMEQPELSQPPPSERQMEVTPSEPMALEPPVTYEEPKSRWSKAGSDLKEHPVSVRVGGGIQGETGDLNDKLTIGPMWTGTLGVQALPWMGAEVGYQGSVHEVDEGFAGVGGDTGLASGADFVSNGGQLAVTGNIPSPILQPYALAGIGFDHFEFRGAANPVFRDDTAGRVPLGGGIRSSVGALSADLRFNYNVLFSQDFARFGGDGPGATYDTTLNIGGRF